MLSTRELNLKINKWESVIEGSAGRQTNLYILAYCKFLPGDPNLIHYEGIQKKPEDLFARLYVFREYEKSLRIEDDSIQQMMNPHDGAKPACGIATLFETYFEIHLFPEPAVFDDIWGRMQHDGIMPTHVDIRLEGVTLIDSRVMVWDTPHGWLPITEFKLKAGFQVPDTNE